MNAPATRLVLASILFQAIDAYTCYDATDGYCLNDVDNPRCYAGTSDTACICLDRKEAHVTGQTMMDDGVLLHEYECCDAGTTSGGTTDGTCVDYATDDGDGCSQLRCISVAVSGSGSDCWVKDGDSHRCRDEWDIKLTGREEIMSDGHTYAQFTCCPVEDMGWVGAVIIVVIVFICCCGPCICFCRYKKVQAAKKEEKKILAEAQARQQQQQQIQMAPVVQPVMIQQPQPVQVQYGVRAMQQPLPVQPQQVYQQRQSVQQPPPAYVNQQQFQQPRPPAYVNVQQQYQISQQRPPMPSAPPPFNPHMQQQARQQLQPGAAPMAAPGAAPVQYGYPGKQM